jgi:hypothetical protein
MSTYLFAFAVGDFEVAKAESKSGVKAKICCRIYVIHFFQMQTIALKQYSEFLPASVKIAAKCIDSLEALLGVDFPLEKLGELCYIFCLVDLFNVMFRSLRITKFFSRRNGKSGTCDLQRFIVSAGKCEQQYAVDSKANDLP